MVKYNDTFNTTEQLVTIIDKLYEATIDNKEYMKTRLKPIINKCFKHIRSCVIANRKPYLYSGMIEDIILNNYFKVTLVGEMLDKNELPTSTKKMKYIKYYKYNKCLQKQSIIYEFIDSFLENNQLFLDTIYKRTNDGITRK